MNEVRNNVIRKEVPQNESPKKIIGMLKNSSILITKKSQRTQNTKF